MKKKEVTKVRVEPKSNDETDCSTGGTIAPADLLPTASWRCRDFHFGLGTQCWGLGCCPA